jgi:hypothetical protein
VERARVTGPAGTNRDLKWRVTCCATRPLDQSSPRDSLVAAIGIVSRPVLICWTVLIAATAVLGLIA